jgi:PIN domain nuclease of toxin-antitoxin system
MRLLIDTHVLLWWDEGGVRLSRSAHDEISNPQNDVLVSAITPLELNIKIRKGKLVMRATPLQIVKANGFSIHPVSGEHAQEAGGFAWSNPDLFDRTIAAQARLDGLVLVHADRRIRALGEVAQLWAGA